VEDTEAVDDAESEVVDEDAAAEDASGG